MGSSNEPNGLHLKALGEAHFLALLAAFAFARPAKCKHRRQHGRQKSEWRKCMSLQHNYLRQIVLGGSGYVKLPDVVTVPGDSGGRSRADRHESRKTLLRAKSHDVRNPFTTPVNAGAEWSGIAILT
jgi:hypothetical protein